MSVLEARNITKVFPGTVALDDVSVSFDSGKVHAIVGKNGSGKSTLLKIISGAQQATSGVLILDGKEVKMYVKKGDHVLTSKYSGTEVKLDDEEYIIVKQSDILAIIQ